MKSNHTTYARATGGYDPEFERALTDAIVDVVVEASRCSDAGVVAIRTCETAQALLRAPTMVIALLPPATHSPTALRKTIDEFGKQLRQRVAVGQAGSDRFRARCFPGEDTGGRA